MSDPIPLPCGCATGPLPPLTVEQFRTMFPAFADAEKYPDATIQIWLDLAPLDPWVWGDRYQLGQGLWVAHELTKMGAGGLAQGAGGWAGGPIQSKSVGPVSLSYNTGLTAMADAGPYNATLYGQQFWMMAKYLAIGPYQIGAATPGPPGSGRPWVGPWPYPSASGFSS